MTDIPDTIVPVNHMGSSLFVLHHFEYLGLQVRTHKAHTTSSGYEYDVILTQIDAIVKRTEKGFNRIHTVRSVHIDIVHTHFCDRIFHHAGIFRTYYQKCDAFIFINIRQPCGDVIILNLGSSAVCIGHG